MYKFWAKNKLIKREIESPIIYYIITATSLILMSVFALVYNDFLVLYYCGLEKESYLEIQKRALSNNIYIGLGDEDGRNTDSVNSETSFELSFKK